MAAENVLRRRWWDFPRSPAAARNLVETAIAHGISARTCLAGTGLDEADIDDAETVVQADQELAIARNLVASTGNPAGLGVEVGRRYQLSTAGIYGFALLSSPTLREAITVGLRFAALTSTFHELSFVEAKGEAMIVFGDRDLPADMRTFLLERDIAAILVIVPLLFGGSLPAGARATFTPARKQSALVALDGLLPIEFEAEHNALIFPQALVDSPLPAADAHTAQMCIQQCEDLLAKRRSRQGIAATVRSQVLMDPAHVPPMRAMAGLLNMTERTLHRHLAREGTSYRALLDEVRETLAAELLASGLTVDEVSRRLGYSETASFTHAFVRWRGAPPSVFRTRLTAASSLTD